MWTPSSKPTTSVTLRFVLGWLFPPRSLFPILKPDVFIQIPKGEKEALGPKLLAGSRHVKDLNDVEFYKVPFEKALDLVSQRSVFLSKGFVYVPSTELGSLITSQFRLNLSKSLVVSEPLVHTLIACWMLFATTTQSIPAHSQGLAEDGRG